MFEPELTKNGDFVLKNDCFYRGRPFLLKNVDFINEDPRDLY